MGPWLVGTIPFGLVIWVSAAEVNIPTFVGWLTGPLIYAGSAQVAIGMLDGGAAPMAVIPTATIINLRLVIYWPPSRPTGAAPRCGGGSSAAISSLPTRLTVGVERYSRDSDRDRGTFITSVARLRCGPRGCSRSGSVRPPVRPSPTGSACTCSSRCTSSV